MRMLMRPTRGIIKFITLSLLLHSICGTFSLHSRKIEVLIAASLADAQLETVRKSIIDIQEKIEKTAEQNGYQLDTNLSPEDKLHITLEYVRDVDDNNLDDYKSCVVELAEETDTFDITNQFNTANFDIFGDWAVLNFSPKEEGPLEKLVSTLRNCLHKKSLKLGRYPDFKAHISLGRFIKKSKKQTVTKDNLNWLPRISIDLPKSSFIIKNLLFTYREKIINTQTGKTEVIEGPEQLIPLRTQQNSICKINQEEKILSGSISKISLEEQAELDSLMLPPFKAFNFEYRLQYRLINLYSTDILVLCRILGITTGATKEQVQAKAHYFKRAIKKLIAEASEKQRDNLMKMIDEINHAAEYISRVLPNSEYNSLLWIESVLLQIINSNTTKLLDINKIVKEVFGEPYGDWPGEIEQNILFLKQRVAQEYSQSTTQKFNSLVEKAYCAWRQEEEMLANVTSKEGVMAGISRWWFGGRDPVDQQELDRLELNKKDILSGIGDPYLYLQVAKNNVFTWGTSLSDIRKTARKLIKKWPSYTDAITAAYEKIHSQLRQSDSSIFLPEKPNASSASSAGCLLQ